ISRTRRRAAFSSGADRGRNSNKAPTTTPRPISRPFCCIRSDSIVCWVNSDAVKVSDGVVEDVDEVLAIAVSLAPCQPDESQPACRPMDSLNLLGIATVVTLL